ncbi:MAG TPA: glycosyltransferase family 1 protein [Chthoniobacterales bacterium]|nr:glycosyltransferase family 1 protein [Chthoniobacterales bacterium]
MVLLIGNYAPDQQQSMQRFSTMMLQGLTAAGVPAELIAPEPFFGNFRGAGAFAAKWLAYVDKFVLFPMRLRAKLRAEGRASARPRDAEACPSGIWVVHICDHSNAMYVTDAKPLPVVVTCHDLLAVRGGLGEETDCPASFTGRLLQRWILRGLRRATAVICVSHATMVDAERLLCVSDRKPALSVATLGLNYRYQKLPVDEVAARLSAIPQLAADKPFVLHVGSNLRRKNRDGVLRAFARTKDRWNGQLVFAGEALTPELQSLGAELRVTGRIVEVRNPDSPLLEALYNRATALLFPSRFEGFGWPIAEAQACGCPVICSDRAPMPEVAGDAGLIHAVDDEEGFAADVVRLSDAAERERWSEKSLWNAERFSTERMISDYIDVYRKLAPQL